MCRFVRNALIVLVAVVALDQIIGYYLDRYFAIKAFEPAEVAYNNKSELVLLGPSEMNNQYVTQMLVDSLGMSAYNYGSGGQNIYYQYVILNLIMNHAEVKPKYVMIEPSGIDIYDTPGWNLEKIDVFFPMYNIDDSLKTVIDLKGWQTSTALGTIRSFKHNSKLFDYIKQIVRPSQVKKSLGYTELEAKPFNDPIDTVDSNDGVNVDNNKIEYLHRLITLCENNSIKLIFINAPYYEIHKDEIWMNELCEILRKRNVFFLNYDNNPYFLSHQEWYNDKEHFNKYGAIEYTKMIIPDLKAIINN